jgi:hypothetical protein
VRGVRADYGAVLHADCCLAVAGGCCSPCLAAGSLSWFTKLGLRRAGTGAVSSCSAAGSGSRQWVRGFVSRQAGRQATHYQRWLLVPALQAWGIIWIGTAGTACCH